ncbi:hypothetical protein ABZX90_26065 [Streptomyces sp. NPDC002935]|uniref:hypothetical protein n=1 Tax=unclassified Streptomyces TaxID=2593676 RepID=UPI00332FA287
MNRDQVQLVMSVREDSLLRRGRIQRIALAGSAALIALRPTAVSAADEPDSGPVEQEVSASLDGAAAASDTVFCTYRAEKPNCSANKMTGVGGIKNCTPHAPFSCNSESEIEWYNPGPAHRGAVQPPVRLPGAVPDDHGFLHLRVPEFGSAVQLPHTRDRLHLLRETANADVSGAVLKARRL